MTSTDSAASFFYGVIVPLRRLNHRAEVDYFTAAPDAGVSYWQPVATRTGGCTQVPGDMGADAFLDQLADYWAAQGDNRLAGCREDIAHLKANLEKIQEKNTDDLSDFVYPLF